MLLLIVGILGNPDLYAHLKVEFDVKMNRMSRTVYERFEFESYSLKIR